MNARQKAKKYKRLYEGLKNESVKTKTIYIYGSDMLQYKGYATLPFEEFWIEEIGDEYVRTLKDHIRSKLADDIVGVIPVEFTLEDRRIVGETSVWVSREALNADKR